MVDLSNFYMDVAKDRLYIAAPTDVRRRTCQTTMQLILEGLATAMSPILPHMAEDIWQNLPYTRPSTSIFPAGWVDAKRFPTFENEAWSSLLKLRDDVNKCMEAGRREGVIGASLEAAVYVYAADESLRQVLDGLVGDSTLQDPPSKSNNVDDLRFLLLTSQIHIVKSEAEVTSSCDAALTLTKDTESGAIVGVKRAQGKKCARCWYYCDSVDNDPDLPHICPRCSSAVKKIGFSPPKEMVNTNK